jgi:uncharacterized membrane protein
MRGPSLVASVATVPLVYVVGLWTVGRGAGLVAAAWFALSPFQIFYGTETRAYALVAALVVLSTYSLLAALDERRLRWWTLFALASAAAVYTTTSPRWFSCHRRLGRFGRIENASASW